MAKADRKMKRAGGKVTTVSLSSLTQVEEIRKHFKEGDPNGKVETARLATFTNDNTIKVSTFPLLTMYRDDDNGIVLILNPNEPAGQRMFGRK